MLSIPFPGRRPSDEYALGETIPSTLTVPYNTWATPPFLKLPPELRNMIYDLVFLECRVLIIGNHPQKELVRWKRRHPSLRGPIPRYRLSCRLLANKDSRTTFQFNSIKTINKFLNSASKTGITNITSIDIIQSCYGPPYYAEDTRWKRKADKKWLLVCSRIAREISSLQYLDIDLTLATWPTQLKTTDTWARPLMVLQGADLHHVRITLHHNMFIEPRLVMTARSLEDLMMTAKGREERDLQKPQDAGREFEKKEGRKVTLMSQIVASLAIPPDLQ